MDRASRERCWSGRDKFFSCLDANNIIDPIKESDKTAKFCSQDYAKFQDGCVATWVSGILSKSII